MTAVFVKSRDRFADRIVHSFFVPFRYGMCDRQNYTFYNGHRKAIGLRDCLGWEDSLPFDMPNVLSPWCLGMIKVWKKNQT